MNEMELRMENIRACLVQNAADYGISITPRQADQFQLYFEQLVDWNQKMNLTAITEGKAVVVKHFLDSILLMKELKGKEKLIDVGTGAGFPGIPLRIMLPELKLTLLDSLNKRLLFLTELKEQLGIEAEIVHARAEEGGRMPAWRTAFDVVTARAVAPLNLLCEYCLPFVKMDGCFFAMKGPSPEEELKHAEHAVELLGCVIDCTKKFELPGGDARSLIQIRRVKPLSPLYPRHGSKIAKNPL